MNSFSLRLAEPGDAAQIAGIYAPFCLGTAVSFETAAPDEAMMRERICTAAERYPCVRLHEKIGFHPIGIYRRVGFKLRKWHDVGWWSRDLLPEGDEPSDHDRFVRWSGPRK